jgi:hypothetical protein
MTKYLNFVKIMPPEESKSLFGMGGLEWNLQPSRADIVNIVSRASQAEVDPRFKWKRGMPIPEIHTSSFSGVESIIVSVEAEDGRVYTGIATRYFDPERFDDNKHQVHVQYLLGDNQETIYLDSRMFALGFNYHTDEPIPQLKDI